MSEFKEEKQHHRDSFDADSLIPLLRSTQPAYFKFQIQPIVGSVIEFFFKDKIRRGIVVAQDSSRHEIHCPGVESTFVLTDKEIRLHPCSEQSLNDHHHHHHHSSNMYGFRRHPSHEIELPFGHLVMNKAEGNCIARPEEWFLSSRLADILNTETIKRLEQCRAGGFCMYPVSSRLEFQSGGVARIHCVFAVWSLVAVWGSSFVHHPSAFQTALDCLPFFGVDCQGMVKYHIQHIQPYWSSWEESVKQFIMDPLAHPLFQGSVPTTHDRLNRIDKPIATVQTAFKQLAQQDFTTETVAEIKSLVNAFMMGHNVHRKSPDTLPWDVSSVFHDAEGDHDHGKREPRNGLIFHTSGQRHLPLALLLAVHRISSHADLTLIVVPSDNTYIQGWQTATRLVVPHVYPVRTIKQGLTTDTVLPDPWLASLDPAEASVVLLSSNVLAPWMARFHDFFSNTSVGIRLVLDDIRFQDKFQMPTWVSSLWILSDRASGIFSWYDTLCEVAALRGQPMDPQWTESVQTLDMLFQGDLHMTKKIRDERWNEKVYHRHRQTLVESLFPLAVHAKHFRVELPRYVLCRPPIVAQTNVPNVFSQAPETMLLTTWLTHVQQLWLHESVQDRVTIAESKLRVFRDPIHTVHKPILRHIFDKAMNDESLAVGRQLRVWKHAVQESIFSFARALTTLKQLIPDGSSITDTVFCMGTFVARAVEHHETASHSDHDKEKNAFDVLYQLCVALAKHFETKRTLSFGPRLSGSDNSNSRANAQAQVPKADNDWICSICREQMTIDASAPRLMPCGHMFCYECIRFWIVCLEEDQRHKKLPITDPHCPMCRGDIPVSDAAASFRLPWSEEYTKHDRMLDSLLAVKIDQVFPVQYRSLQLRIGKLLNAMSSATSFSNVFALVSNVDWARFHFHSLVRPTIQKDNASQTDPKKHRHEPLFAALDSFHITLRTLVQLPPTKVAHESQRVLTLLIGDPVLTLDKRTKDRILSIVGSLATHVALYWFV